MTSEIGSHYAIIPLILTLAVDREAPSRTMMASLQAPPSDAWLPSWSPESLIGNSFVYLPAVKSNAEDELKFEYASMNVKLVEKMEQAVSVVL